MARKAFLDNEEKRQRVREYVRATGLLKDAWQLVGYKEETGFYVYLRKHPDFHEELKTLQRVSHITETPELIEAALKGLQQALTNNEHIIKDEDANGQLRNRRVIKKPAAKWAIEKVLTKGNYLENALHIFIASLMDFVSRYDMTDNQRQFIHQIIWEFKQQELKELIVRGIQVKEQPHE